MLEALHERVSAMEPPIVNSIQGWERIPEGQSVYLDNDGNPIALSDADEQTLALLADYALIQYDITAGNQYLKDLGFVELAG